MSDNQWYELNLLIEYGGHDVNKPLAQSQDIDKLKQAAQEHCGDGRTLEWRTDHKQQIYANGRGGSGGYHQYTIKSLAVKIIE